MSSNMLTVDRRWAPGRKFTVLGKVPKPINLPSQRLENRGLDPNVEIVPKGTLTWGSRTSTSASNVWGASSLSSPNTDGSSGSPVKGSGPRPSTAGSDMSQEPVSTVWGSTNSRPSSASGIFASSQTSFPANRPRSAETRPGSCQQSRFAECLTENTSAWGPSKSGERVASSSRTCGFTLCSGDFPTLGAEKSFESHISKEYGSQGRPTSTVSTKKEVLLYPSGMSKADMTTISEDVNAWNNSSTGVGSHIENSQSEIQEGLQQRNDNSPPQQFDSWRGSPVCPSDGLLQGVDPLEAVPFRKLTITSVCYPTEASSHYPQVPAQFGNPQIAARIENMPGDCYLKSEEMFHPHPQSESFMVSNVPVMPARPGMCFGPQTYDVYYGRQPSLYRFSNKHGLHKDTTSAASVYNHNIANPGDVSKEVKSDHINVPCQGHFKVLLKQHDDREDKYAHDKKEQFSRSSQIILIEDKHEVGSKDVDWKTEGRKDERPTSSKCLPSKGPSLGTNIWNAKSSETEDTKISSLNKIDDKETTKQPEPDTHLIHDQKRHPVNKNTALIEKIDVLNSKARMVDSQSETAPVILQQKSTHSKAVTVTDVSLPRSSLVDAVNEKFAVRAVGFSLSRDAGASHEESSHGGRALKRSGASNKIDPCEEVRKNPSHFKKLDPSVTRSDCDFIKGPDGVEDELKYRTLARSVHTAGAIGDGECGSSSSLADSNSSIVRNEQFHHTHNSSVKEQFAGSLTDLADTEAQHSKFKKRAVQHSELLQQEEEERVREQKARALAKLEGLDKRTRSQNRESSSNFSFGSDYQLKVAISVNVPFDNSAGISVAMEPPGHKETKSQREGSHLSSSSSDGLAVSCDQSLTLSHIAGCIEKNIMQRDFMDVCDHNLVNNEQLGYGGKEIIALEEKLVECSANSNNLGNPKKSDEEILQFVAVDNAIPPEGLLIQNKKKSVKNARNKNKFNQGGTQGRNPSSQPEDPISLTAQALHESDLAKIMPNEGDASSMRRSPMTINEQHQGSVSNQWKPQSLKKSGRNQQTQGSEAVVWAPVKPQSKNITPEEDIQNSKTESSRSLSVNNGQMHTCQTKIKRAEMERYVPKSAAKEVSRPENSPLASSTTSQVSPSNVTVDADISKSGTGMPSDTPVASAEMTSVDNCKANRHVKVRASWRQRNPYESNQQDLHVSGEVDKTSETVDVVGWPCDQHKELKPKPMEQFKLDSLKDEVEIPKPSELGAGPFCKDQGVASKHRHQRYKAQGASVDAGAHHAPKDLPSGPSQKNGADPPDSEVSEPGGRGILEVNDRNAGNNEQNRRARRLPKSQDAHVGRGRSLAPENESPVLDFSTGRSSRGFIHGNQDADSTIQGIRGSYIKPASNQEGNNREKLDRIGVVQKQTQSPTEFTDVEPGLHRADHYHHRQHGSLQRHGQNNDWLDKHQELIYGGLEEGQDTKGVQNLHSGGNNKRRNGSHFEYQPIGSHNNKPGESQLKPFGDFDAPGAVIPRASYRAGQQVQNHPRRSGCSYERRNSSDIGVGRYGGSK